MLQSMVSQRVGHDLATERQKHTETIFGSFVVREHIISQFSSVAQSGLTL